MFFGLYCTSFWLWFHCIGIGVGNGFGAGCRWWQDASARLVMVSSRPNPSAFFCPFGQRLCNIWLYDCDELLLQQPDKQALELDLWQEQDWCPFFDHNQLADKLQSMEAKRQLFLYLLNLQFSSWNQRGVRWDLWHDRDARLSMYTPSWKNDGFKHETNKPLLVPLKESYNMRVSLLSRKRTRLSSFFLLASP